MLQRSRVFQLRLLFLSTVLLLTACIPVIRTEYLSPSWQGRLVDSQTGKALQGVEVNEQFTKAKTVTDEDGFFKFEPMTSEFSFKLPAASTASYFQLVINAPGRDITISGHRLITTVEPSLFDIGTFPIGQKVSAQTFYLKDKENNQQVQLPKKLIDGCFEPITNAIYLSQVARFYKKLWQESQTFSGKVVNNHQVSLAYHWANLGWEELDSKCFKHNYVSSKALSAFQNLFFEEANQYATQGFPH